MPSRQQNNRQPQDSCFGATSFRDAGTNREQRPFPTAPRRDVERRWRQPLTVAPKHQLIPELALQSRPRYLLRRSAAPMFPSYDDHFEQSMLPALTTNHPNRESTRGPVISRPRIQPSFTQWDANPSPNNHTVEPFPPPFDSSSQPSSTSTLHFNSAFQFGRTKNPAPCQQAPRSQTYFRVQLQEITTIISIFGRRSGDAGNGGALFAGAFHEDWIQHERNLKRLSTAYQLTDEDKCQLIRLTCRGGPLAFYDIATWSNLMSYSGSVLAFNRRYSSLTRREEISKILSSLQLSHTR